MSKESTENEAAAAVPVPIPMNIAVNNDEEWAAEHTEHSQFPVEDDEESLMSVVDDISKEIISEYAEDFFRHRCCSKIGFRKVGSTER